MSGTRLPVALFMAHWSAGPRNLPARRTPFHWPLEFPDILANGSASGLGPGFDVVLGNPPWERIKLQEQEFFAAREPEIAEAPNAAARGTLIAKLKAAAPSTRERRLYDEFEAAKREAEASSAFARVAAGDGGRFPLTGRGDVNTYALFAELFASLASPRGRAGLIVPSGLALDRTTHLFFQNILGRGRLISFFEFENVGFFTAGHGHMLRFALATIGPKATVVSADFFFQCQAIPELKVSERHFQLGVSDIRVLNPTTGTAAIFQSKYDAELNIRVYLTNGVLQVGEQFDSHEWPIDLAVMFHTSNDSKLFKTGPELRGHGFEKSGVSFAKGNEVWRPFYEAKMMHQYNHRHGDYRGVPSGKRPHRLPRLDVGALNDPNRELLPFYWVNEKDIKQRLDLWNWRRRWISGWRDVADARASPRSSVFAALPTFAIGDTILLMMPRGDFAQAACILGLVNSLPFDYFARQKIGGLKFKFFTLRQITVPQPTKFNEQQNTFIARRVLELTYTSHLMAPFARDLGYDGPPFAWDEDRRALLRTELDALYARAYGLARDELRYILDPADVKGPDYPSETFRVLKKNEIARFGEYRTARLVLAAWDRLERGELGK
jgi:hypothetical protein